jgi:hypothetical protein
MVVSLFETADITRNAGVQGLPRGEKLSKRSASHPSTKPSRSLTSGATLGTNKELANRSLCACQKLATRARQPWNSKQSSSTCSAMAE